MSLRAAVVASVLAVLVAGCGSGSSSPIQPQYQPQIINLTDSFAFQLTGVTNGDGSLSYTWQNTGTAASIDRSSSITGGTVTLTVRDAANAQVYQATLGGATGSVSTAAGVAGNWTILVDFVHTTGTINFRAQKL
jgi:hypothetical protein